MGCTSSKLKGDDVNNLNSSYPSNSEPRPSLPTQKATTPPLPTGTDTETETRNPDTKTFDTTHTVSQPHVRPPNEEPRKQSLRSLWRERKGVHEPQDENGRGLYSRMTTEELVKMGGAQPVDGRALAGGTV